MKGKDASRSQAGTRSVWHNIYELPPGFFKIQYANLLSMQFCQAFSFRAYDLLPRYGILLLSDFAAKLDTRLPR